MTKNEAYILGEAISAVANLSGVKFAYAMAKNASILKPEIDAIKKAAENSKEFTEYDKKRIELAKKFSEKDKNGEPKMEDFVDRGRVSQRYVMADRVAFDTAWDELKETYKDAIESRKKQNDDVDNLLKEEIEIKFYQIPLEEVPKEITAGQLQGIFPLIQEPNA